MATKAQKEQQLKKEFEGKYGRMPNKNDLRQYVGWKESHSDKIWASILEDMLSAKERREAIDSKSIETNEE